MLFLCTFDLRLLLKTKYCRFGARKDEDFCILFGAENRLKSQKKLCGIGSSARGSTMFCTFHIKCMGFLCVLHAFSSPCSLVKAEIVHYEVGRTEWMLFS